MTISSWLRDFDVAFTTCETKRLSALFENEKHTKSRNLPE